MGVLLPRRRGRFEDEHFHSDVSRGIFAEYKVFMGRIGFGYGSEWHLLRHLGYHREYLSLKTLNVTGGRSIEWLDFDFSKENAPLRDDREFLGLEFI